MTQHARPDGQTPLDGVLVADFSRVLAGPSAAMTLADLGATVVKVEHPDGGDDTRRWGPPWTEGGSSYFDAVNRTKRSIALDLRDPADLAVAHELVARADVLVENFRPRSLDGFGLAPAATLRMNPRLVHCSVTGFGAGAGADLPGYDLVVQAVGGLMSITGQADGVLAALRHRDVTGLGQHVEVNLLQSLIGSLANQASAFLASGVAPTRLGNAHPSIAPYESLRCADGLLVVACGNDGQFGRLCDVLGLDDLRGDPRFATNGDRVAHRDELVRLLEDVLGQRPAAEWQALLTSASVPAGGVNDIAQGIELATSLGLDPVVEIDGASPQVAHPVRYSAFTSTPPTAPPALGQHSSEIRRWLTTLHQEHA